MLEGVVGSYEIEFVGSQQAADILMEALRMGKVRAEVVERTEHSLICHIDSRESKRIVILCNGELRSDGCIMVVNAKKAEKGKIAINADAIARKLNSEPEMALLGVLARLGIIGLHHIMAAALRKGYNHAIAAKRGYESANL